MDFLVGNAKLYIALAILASLSGFYYLKYESTEAKLEKARSDLDLALQVNQHNQERLKELTQIQEKQLKALSEANALKSETKERVEYVKEYIYKSKEGNITKLFNDIVNRLWDNNATNGNQNTNSKG